MTKKGSGAPPWMVTFADLMSLLVTFFVLLLSVSEIDAEKYRQIAGAMKVAFSGTAFIQLSTTPGSTPSATPQTPVPVSPPQPKQEQEPAPADGVDHDLQRFEQGLSEQLKQGLLEVNRNREGELMISFRHEAAFESGSEVLLPQFLPVVDRIAGLIATTHGTVVVAGHTDDRPINTPRFRSNWDLSAARAASVVHRLLEMHKIEPKRLIVEGFADTRPVVPNDNEQNRARNRRVEIRIKDHRAGNGGNTGETS